MQIENLVKKNRSYRRFDNSHRLSKEELKYFVELARHTASAANRQPLKYFLSLEEETNNKIFSTLSWAGYLKDWKEPVKEERPSAYLVVLGDTDITRKYFCDAGIALQTMLLGAVEKDLGGCIFAAIDKEKLRDNLELDERFEILYVLALGRPVEKVVIEDMEDDDIKYWRDKDQVHHVPKRPLDELIIN